MQSGNPSTFTANEVILPGARVNLRSDGKIENAVATVGSAATREIGVALFYSGKSSYAIGDSVGVSLYWPSITCIANTAIAAFAVVQRAAAGKVAITGSGAVFGVAAEASAADGDLIAVYRTPIA